MKTGNTDFVYKNELDKACFQHDMASGKSKDLIKRTQSDKVLRDKAFKKFKKRKFYSSFRDNIWGVDLADMQQLSKYDKGIKYLLCTIDLFSKYALVIPLKDKKRISIANAFQKILRESNRKLNKIWTDQGSKFYKNSFKDFLKINNIEIYSTFNEGKSLVVERFIRTLKNKIFKHMTAISKNIYFDKLDNIVNKYNNTVYRTIKVKPIDVMSDSYTEYNKDFN